MSKPFSIQMSAAAAGRRGHLAQAAQDFGPLYGVLLGALVLTGGIGLIMLQLRYGRLRRRRTVLASFAVIVVTSVLVGMTVSHDSGPAVARTPGVPLLSAAALGAQRVPVLVVPNRPGFNLVGVAADGASAGTDPGRLTAGRRYSGSERTWVGVTLGAGEQRLYVSANGVSAALDVDTGHEPAAESATLRGTDGPECAAAALGALLAGSERPWSACPADRLAAADTAMLRSTVHFLAARGTRSVALRSDDSPRARAAAAVVREAATRERLSVVAPGKGAPPLLVVAGWAVAETQVKDVAAGRVRAEGTYLAPWLLSPPVLGPSAGQIIPLRYDPRGPAAERYLSALAGRFPGELPSAAGYEAWQRQLGGDFAPTLLYAAAEVYIPGMPSHQHSKGADWLTSGMITPVSGPLRQPTP
ncbi:hypothetical protein [Streptomyces sp. NPDC002685]|uniref:hypothetical protein n=1 Tax=Streptomyces sp. NPDC002685 TaxID=3154540 RepID=UPI003316981F